VLTEPEQIADHISIYYKNLFSTNLVNEQTNNLLTLIPSETEIKEAFFSLNGDGAPGHDGFGGHFFQTYWSIVKVDVINVVMEFFTSSWLPPNFNSNALVQIPKSPNADTVDQYMPISLANFKLKIITKVIAEMVAKIMPILISNHQRGFVQGRQIKECICLTSKNLLVGILL